MRYECKDFTKWRENSLKLDKNKQAIIYIYKNSYKDCIWESVLLKTKLHLLKTELEKKIGSDNLVVTSIVHGTQFQ